MASAELSRRVEKVVAYSRSPRSVLPLVVDCRDVIERIDVATVGYLHGSTHQLHVLLRHRLLPQPGGFQGFACVGQHISNDLAASQREDAPGERIYSRAAGLATSLNVSHRDDLIARIDDPVEPNLEGLKGVREAGPSTERLHPDAVVVGFRKPRSAENRLALVVEDVPSPAPVPVLPVFDEPPHYLDVLPRHHYSDSPAASRAS